MTGRRRVASVATALTAWVAVCGAAAEPQRATAASDAASVSADARGTGPTPRERSVAGRAVLRRGHVDLGPRIVDGRWRIRLRDERPDVPALRDPAEVVLHVPTAARQRVPDDPALRVLGRPGAAVWALPQTQDPRLVWPGWSTEDAGVARSLRGPARWRLNRVEAPEGASARGFALLVASGFGAPEVLFAGSRPLPQTTSVAGGTHAHGTWAFPAPGVWVLHVAMGATLRDGTRVEDRTTLRFAVGAGDPRAAFAGGDGADDGDDPPTAALVGGAGGLVLVVAAAAVWSSRRRGAHEDGR